MSAYADVTLNGIFTDHMVLQRDMPVAVYGTAEPGEKVAVSFAGQSKAATADKDGNWLVKLDAMKASADPAGMSVAGKNKLTLDEIVVGDVWVCSGQSNMDFCPGSYGGPFDVVGRWMVWSPKTGNNICAVGLYFARKVHLETGVPIGLVKAAWNGTRIEPWISPGPSSYLEGARGYSPHAKQRSEAH